MSVWAVAQSPILVTTVTLQRLKKRGYEPMFSHQSIPQLNEPPYARPVTTVCERRTSSLTTGEAIRLCAVLLYKGFQNFPVDVRNSYVSRLVAGYDFVAFVIPCHAP